MKKYYPNLCSGIIVILMALIIPLGMNAQTPCSDFEIQFLKKNVMACNTDVVFQLTEGGVQPPPNVSNIDLNSTSGFTYSSEYYDMGTGEFTIYGVSVTDYSGYGTFTVTVHHGLGDPCEMTGHIVKCCENVNPDYIIVDEDLNDYTAATSFSGDVFVMMGDVGFQANSYSFTDCDFYLGPDAQMLPQVNAELYFNSCNLDAFCDCRWDRILLAHNSNDLTMEDCSIKGALRAIHATDEVPIEIGDFSKFTNNYLSLYLQNFSGSGPYNGSYLKTDGTTFDITADPDIVYCYDDLQSRVNMSAIWSAVCNGTSDKSIDIFTRQCDNVHIGHESYSPNQFKNTTAFDRTAIAINNSQTFVRNNEFFPVLTNVCSSNSSKVFIGGSAAQGNSFKQGLVHIDQSSAIINRNLFDGADIVFKRPVDLTVATGYTTGSEMLENDFIECAWLADGAGGNITYFRIVNNSFFETQAKMLNLPSNSSLSKKLIFHSNYCETSTTAYPAEIQNCHGVTFANNHLENLRYYTPYAGNALEYVGVRWLSTKDATVSNNYLENFSRGFQVEGDCRNTNVAVGTQFTCNQFVNCYHGFYFSGTSYILNQGSSSKASDNYFNYYYVGGSFPYGAQHEGAVNSSTVLYMREPTSCAAGSKPYSSSYCLDESVGNFSILGNATPIACTMPPDNSAVSNYPNAEGGEPIEVEDQLGLYPNPSSGWVTLKLPENQELSLLRVFDRQGRVVHSIHNPETGIRFNVSDWTPGLYLVKTNGYTAKLMVK